jgi:hypothetical protein
MCSQNCSTFWGSVVHDTLCQWTAPETCAIAPKALIKMQHIWQYYLSVIKSIRMYQLVFVGLKKCISDQMQESVTNARDALANWNSKQGLVSAMSWFVDADSFVLLLQPRLRSQNEIHIWVAKTWLSIAKDPIEFRWFSGELCAICLRFFKSMYGIDSSNSH